MNDEETTNVGSDEGSEGTVDSQTQTTEPTEPSGLSETRQKEPARNPEDDEMVPKKRFNEMMSAYQRSLQENREFRSKMAEQQIRALPEEVQDVARRTLELQQQLETKDAELTALSPVVAELAKEKCILHFSKQYNVDPDSLSDCESPEEVERTAKKLSTLSAKSKAGSSGGSSVKFESGGRVSGAPGKSFEEEKAALVSKYRGTGDTFNYRQDLRKLAEKYNRPGEAPLRIGS